ncbi:unnamed protein product [Oppiella nova]|uniref:Single-stranded DNA-binding protein, mitochondrial n=1 Tax=Oppiella nova TaxID=334625 RepID=A0A7R9QV41_9ACAR|nr:unnamed protein product [Oppiella nova]CAG2175481.1 unnamed protein product [Oppiella nova]
MFRTIYSRLSGSHVLSNINCVQNLVTNKYSTGRPIIEKGINQVILMGRCGTDALKRGTDSRPVIIFSLATHTHFKNQETDELQQKTDWHRISVFRNRLQEKTLNFAKKGSRLLVQGRISYGEITDANGVSHQTTSIIADDVIFLSSGRVATEEDVDEAIEA